MGTTDTELLDAAKKIVQNTEPKTSTQIVVSENSTKIKTTFNPPLELDKTRKYEMALVNLATYYSFINIDSSNNVFRCSPDGSQWVDIRIPEGSYDLIDIAEVIKLAMKRNGHNDVAIKITANTNTLKNVMEIQGDFIVVFRVQRSIASILGFRNQVYKEGLHESESVVNILSINSILMNSDIIRGSYVNGKTQFTVSFQTFRPDIKLLKIRETLCIFQLF